MSVIIINPNQKKQYLGIMPRYLFASTLFLLLLVPTLRVSFWYDDVAYSLNLLILQFAICLASINLHQLRTHYKYFVIYLALVYSSEIASAFSAYYLHTNMYISHLIPPLQIVLISFVLFGILKISKNLRPHWILGISILVALLIGLSAFYGTSQFASIGIILFSFFMVVGALFVLKKIALSSSTLSLYQHPDFWFSIGSLTFYSVTFFIYAYLWMPGVKPAWTYTLIIFSNVFMSCCYLLSLLKEIKFNKTIW